MSASSTVLTAPAGAPASKVKVSAWPGTSLSVAVAVKLGYGLLRP